MQIHSRRRFLVRSAQAAGVAGLGSLPKWSRAASGGADPADLTAKAIEFLRSRQEKDGSWSPDRGEPGITALAVAGLLRSKRVPPGDPTVVKALAHLEGYLGTDGGLSKARHSSYTTAVGLMAFQDANQGGRYDGLIKGAQQYLRGTQFDESKGKTPSDPYYGGAGYGPQGGPPPGAPPKDAASQGTTAKKAVPRAPRPDLSNTAFMIEALRSTGIPADDPGMQKALVFVSRCQNLKSEFNDQPWAGKVNDGGFIYTVANGGTSIAGKTSEGAPRSYGSMTYAGLERIPIERIA